ncbi:MAG: hypothetical protein ACP5N2_07490 [Candidatus Nanoarchaeia archaeon]
MKDIVVRDMDSITKQITIKCLNEYLNGNWQGWCAQESESLPFLSISHRDSYSKAKMEEFFSKLYLGSTDSEVFIGLEESVFGIIDSKEGQERENYLKTLKSATVVEGYNQCKKRGYKNQVVLMPGNTKTLFVKSIAAKEELTSELDNYERLVLD